ncbi:MAG: hypothetical protein ACRD3C_05885 [Vicinamibacterales bacterium]
MSSIEAIRPVLAGWLDCDAAHATRLAIESTGVSPDEARSWLRSVTEEPSSSARILCLVSAARRRGAIPEGSVAIERWLLVRQGLDAIDSEAMATLGDHARRLTSQEIATLVEDDPWLQTGLVASNVRFREFAKIVTGRRFCAGLFHWEECGVRRSWLFRVPPRDWMSLGTTLLHMGGLGPMMFPHLNPRRRSPHLQEPDINQSLAVLAESLDRRPDLRGMAAASWLRSPDTHRVSPKLAAVNAPILAGGGFVTTVGAAPDDCGVLANSQRRSLLYQEGKFKPTIGLVLWPRDAMLRWWRAHPTLASGSWLSGPAAYGEGDLN